MSAGRQVWCAGLEKLAQLCSWGSYTWQMSRKETYCHCQLKSTWIAEHDLKKIWEHSAMHLAWCYIVDNLPSPLIFHLQTSPVFHQKAAGCWTAICDGDSDVLVMLFATSAHPHLPFDCGVASSSLWQCFVNLCGFKISLKGRNIHLGTTHAKWCLSVFQFSNAVSFWN